MCLCWERMSWLATPAARLRTSSLGWVATRLHTANSFGHATRHRRDASVHDRLVSALDNDSTMLCSLPDDGLEAHRESGTECSSTVSNSRAAPFGK